MASGRIRLRHVDRDIDWLLNLRVFDCAPRAIRSGHAVDGEVLQHSSY